METHFPGIGENVLQVRLIEKKAREMGVPPKDIEKDWVENFSTVFRDLWDSGEHDIELLEEKLYAPEAQNHYAEVVSKLILC